MHRISGTKMLSRSARGAPVGGDCHLIEYQRRKLDGKQSVDAGVVMIERRVVHAACLWRESVAVCQCQSALVYLEHVRGQIVPLRATVAVLLSLHLRVDLAPLSFGRRDDVETLLVLHSLCRRVRARGVR